MIDWLESRKKISKTWSEDLKFLEFSIEELKRDEFSQHFQNVFESTKHFFDFIDIFSKNADSVHFRKNLLGRYSESRLEKLWSILAAMKKRNLHLVQGVKFLLRIVRFEVWALFGQLEHS